MLKNQTQTVPLLTMKEGEALKTKLLPLMKQLDDGEISTICFGQTNLKLTNQNVTLMEITNTAGGTQYGIKLMDISGRTGSGTYYPLTDDGRNHAIIDMLDLALAKLYNFRQQKARFATLERIQKTRESDFSFFSDLEARHG